MPHKILFKRQIQLHLTPYKYKQIRNDSFPNAQLRNLFYRVSHNTRENRATVSPGDPANLDEKQKVRHSLLSFVKRD